MIAPTLSVEQAADLLDHVLYEQIISCVDLDALNDLEQALTVLAGELDGIGAEQAAELARSMISAGLRRLPDDVRRYLRRADG